jgi:hypothetical protein
MATTKKTTNRRTPRSRTTTPRSTSSANPSLATRTGKAIAKRPVASAAIATGLVSGIAAAVAGFFAFKKSGKSFSEFSGDIATSVKDRAGETSAMVKDGLADAGAKAKDRVSKIRDGVDGEKSQAEIAEEALTLKQTGQTSEIPADPVVEQQSKVGAISY